MLETTWLPNATTKHTHSPKCDSTFSPSRPKGLNCTHSHEYPCCSLEHFDVSSCTKFSNFGALTRHRSSWGQLLSLSFDLVGFFSLRRCNPILIDLHNSYNLEQDQFFNFDFVLNSYKILNVICLHDLLHFDMFKNVFGVI